MPNTPCSDNVNCGQSMCTSGSGGGGSGSSGDSTSRPGYTVSKRNAHVATAVFIAIIGFVLIGMQYTMEPTRTYANFFIGGALVLIGFLSLVPILSTPCVDGLDDTCC